MEGGTLAALVVFAAVMSFTPGPNNVMLLASGLNFGVRRTVPHMAGITVGVTVMLVAVGLGLSGLFHAVPALLLALKWVGAAYMLWLAWRIAHAAPVDADGPAPRPQGRPMPALAAAAFQWVNPKAWVMAVTAMATYGGAGSLGAVLVVAGVFGLVSVFSTATWAVFGAALRRVLSDPRHVRWFNWAMAALLVLSLWPLLADLQPVALAPA